MNRPIVLGVAALLLFALGVIAANTRIAQGVIPVTAYEADVNKDAHVNVADLGLVASKYGKPVPTATPTPSVRCDLAGHSLGSGASLRNLSLDGCDLRGLNAPGLGLYDVTLRNADLRSVTFFEGPYLDGVLATGADLRNAAFYSGGFVGGLGNDFSQADFSGASFTNMQMVLDADEANFRGAYFDAVGPGAIAMGSFRMADFRDATFLTFNFVDADLTGSLTTGANLIGPISWANTVCPDGTNSDNNGGSCIGHGFAGTPLPTWTPTATPTATATPETCAGASANARWTSGNGHCYQRFDNPLNFANAKADCTLRGGHLSTITSEAEQDFVWQNVGVNHSWFGYTDEVAEGDWRWVNDEPAGYSNWGIDEPNNSGNEDAGEFGDPGGFWNDNVSTNTQPYICETP